MEGVIKTTRSSQLKATATALLGTITIKASSQGPLLTVPTSKVEETGNHYQASRSITNGLQYGLKHNYRPDTMLSAALPPRNTEERQGTGLGQAGERNVAASCSWRGLTLPFHLAPCPSAETSHGLFSPVNGESGAPAASWSQALTCSESPQETLGSGPQVPITGWWLPTTSR